MFYEIKIKGWWWKRLFSKYRKLKRMSQFILDDHVSYLNRVKPNNLYK